MAFVGYTDDNPPVLDTDLAERYGITVESNDAGWEESLETACNMWEKYTGRVYGRTTNATLNTTMTRNQHEMFLPVFQSVESVQYFNNGTFEDIASDKYDAIKLDNGRGTYDTLYSKAFWRQGLYKVEALWGEAEVPQDVQFGVLKFAAFLFKVQGKPSAFGVDNNQEGIVDLEMLPGSVYKILQQDRLSSRFFGRDN